MPKVLIQPATYGNIRQAVDRALEVFPLDLKGKKVLVKPNALRASHASEGIVTHPSLVRAVVEKVESLGPASIVVGDNPGLRYYGANEEVFQESGLMEAARGHYRNIGAQARKVQFNADYMESVSLSRAVVDSDVIISLPKFKTHGLTLVSGAIKNSYGFLPGAQKARLHKAAGTPTRFNEMLIDVFRLRIPDLFIVDAVVGMEGNGPASPDLRDIGVLLASDNGVAMDAVIATMMGCDPSQIRFLQKAKEEGLGDYDLSRIEVVGELRRLPDFKLPPLRGEVMVQDEQMQEVIHKRTTARPRPNPETCTGCGTCVEHCPVSAISLENGLPRVDGEACIICFCCQEICPEKAIVLT